MLVNIVFAVVYEEVLKVYGKLSYNDIKLVSLLLFLCVYLHLLKLHFLICDITFSVLLKHCWSLSEVVVIFPFQERM